MRKTKDYARGSERESEGARLLVALLPLFLEEAHMHASLVATDPLVVSSHQTKTLGGDLRLVKLIVDDYAKQPTAQNTFILQGLASLGTSSALPHAFHAR